MHLYILTAIAKLSVINGINVSAIFVHLLAKYGGSFLSKAIVRKFSLCFGTWTAQAHCQLMLYLRIMHNESNSLAHTRKGYNIS